jgi:four helix bundle protein
MLIGNYNDLIAYKKAFELAMKIFEISKSFPAEEKYSLTNQIRRSSRSVCANLAESYTRRKFRNYFISKLNDVECENAETQVWLDLAFNCSYITPEKYQELTSENNEIGKLTWFMIHNTEKFL